MEWSGGWAWSWAERRRGVFLLLFGLVHCNIVLDEKLRFPFLSND
jgi:hypothetical protein